MAINKAAINFYDIQEVMDALTELLSQAVYAKKCKELEGHFRIQLPYQTPDNADDLENYLPQEKEFRALVLAFQAAQMFKNEPVNMRQRFGFWTYSQMDRYVESALSEVFHVRVRDPIHVFRLVRKYQLNKPGFISAMIRSIVDEQIEMDTRWFMIYLGEATNGQVNGLRKLWGEATRRWPDLKELEIESQLQLVPEIVVSRCRQIEKSVGSFMEF